MSKILEENELDKVSGGNVQLPEVRCVRCNALLVDEWGEVQMQSRILNEQRYCRTCCCNIIRDKK